MWGLTDTDYDNIDIIHEKTRVGMLTSRKYYLENDRNVDAAIIDIKQNYSTLQREAYHKPIE